MHRENVESPDVARFRLQGKPVAYASAVKVTAPGTLIFVSGQNSFDKDGNVVGPGDIEAQARQTLRNIQSVLEAAGATMTDVVKLTAWVTKPEYVHDYVRVRKEFFTETVPGSSTVVSGLVRDELLIEIEAIAAIP
jgi:enamine deaminase RidA (YjgF/YER057c/UK114 family)